jgi:protein-S-isoprenylcysteine O-methyltransferase Ste14
MNDVTARPNSLPWPPIIYLAAIAVSVLLNVFYPLPWFGRPLSGILFVLGWLMIAAFVVLNISAIRVMRRAGTTVRPDRGTDHLVTDGPFSFTRNPLYVAARCLYWGLDWSRALCGFCSLRSPPHSRCKSSPSSGRKGIYKRDSGRPIWIMPAACGDGFS